MDAKNRHFIEGQTGTDWGANWHSGKHRGLRTKGSLVRDLAGSPFVVALSNHIYPLLSTGKTQEAVDVRLTWTDCDKAGDYVVPNVLSPRDLVFRPDNMDETVLHTFVFIHQ